MVNWFGPMKTDTRIFKVSKTHFRKKTSAGSSITLLISFTWAGKTFEGPLTHGRKFTADEIWQNYTYFIKQVVPVAEEVGVRIGIHPDDPPVAELGGVPRAIFSNYNGYVKALEIANSPNVGVCLCCGTWMDYRSRK